MISRRLKNNASNLPNPFFSLVRTVNFRKKIPLVKLISILNFIIKPFPITFFFEPEKIWKKCSNYYRKPAEMGSGDQESI